MAAVTQQFFDPVEARFRVVELLDVFDAMVLFDSPWVDRMRIHVFGARSALEMLSNPDLPQDEKLDAEWRCMECLRRAQITYDLDRQDNLVVPDLLEGHIRPWR